MASAEARRGRSPWRPAVAGGARRGGADAGQPGDAGRLIPSLPPFMTVLDARRFDLAVNTRQLNRVFYPEEAGRIKKCPRARKRVQKPMDA